MQVSKLFRFSLSELSIYTKSLFYKKNKNLWVFGAWHGDTYSDNSKYLFEYVTAEHPEIRCVWVTHRDEIVEIVRNAGYEAYIIDSKEAKRILNQASVFIVTEGYKDVGGYKHARTKLIQLWHGVAPKKMQWSTDIPKWKKFIVNILYDNHKKSFWMCSSERNIKTMHELLNIDVNKAYATGYPRNDQFVHPRNKSQVICDLERSHPGMRKIIYMPTHRNFGSEGTAFSAHELIEVDQLLKEKDIVMLFKPHIHEIKNYEKLNLRLSNIVMGSTATYNDVYSYISDFDLLISDYSSIIYDFQCTKKPIVLFPYDMDKFGKSDAGLFDYYTSLPCGPFCNNWIEVIAQVELLLKSDPYYEQRERCRREFHPFDDGKNCERVYNAIRKILNQR